MREWWIVLLALCPAAALAQPVFFDDFEGNALLPHWNQPTPSFWEHNVSNSMLNVTGLFFPSSPKSPGNFTGMSALFTPQGDFQMDVWMGWEAGTSPHQLTVDVLGGPSGTTGIASFRYDNAFGPPAIQASTNTGFTSEPAPPPGTYHFTIARAGTQFEFYFNGGLFLRTPGSALQATAVGFFFLGPYPGQLGTLHVDRVLVVPAPGLLVFAPPLAMICAGRRRRNVSAR